MMVILVSVLCFFFFFFFFLLTNQIIHAHQITCFLQFARHEKKNTIEFGLSGGLQSACNTGQCLRAIVSCFSTTGVKQFKTIAICSQLYGLV